MMMVVTVMAVDEHLSLTYGMTWGSVKQNPACLTLIPGSSFTPLGG
jgi:hypothetical protein